MNSFQSSESVLSRWLARILLLGSQVKHLKTQWTRRYFKRHLKVLIQKTSEWNQFTAFASKTISIVEHGVHRAKFTLKFTRWVQLALQYVLDRPKSCNPLTNILVECLSALWAERHMFAAEFRLNL